MHSTNTGARGEVAELEPPERSRLLEVARRSIHNGLATGKPVAVDVAAYPPTLAEKRACFVTLRQQGDLRGCIGHLEPIEPLVRDVADNAFAAAFRDPRFRPVSEGELPTITIELSILTVPTPLVFENEADLIRQLKPGTDGLILTCKGARGTFLPSVWDSLPDPIDFVRHLKVKAGLKPGFWSPDIQVQRYRTECFAEPPRHPH